MPSGALLQLVARGQQDVALYDPPGMSLFTHVYLKPTRFATESIQQTVIGDVSFGKRVVIELSRAGDLVHDLLLELTLPDLESVSANRDKVSWIEKIGHYCIDTVTLEIGGTVVERHTGEWFNVVDQLTRPASKDRGANRMCGNTPQLTNPDFVGKQIRGRKLYIPLRFDCCNPDVAAQSLPMVALQYHGIRVTIDFAAQEKMVVSHSSLYDLIETQIEKLPRNPALSNAIWKNAATMDRNMRNILETIDDPEIEIQDIRDAVKRVREFSIGEELELQLAVWKNIASTVDGERWVTAIADRRQYRLGDNMSGEVYANMVMLDNKERTQMAQMAHDLVIAQVQHQSRIHFGAGVTKPRIPLVFSHPVKELVILCHREDQAQPSIYHEEDADGTTMSPFCSVTLIVNGHERFSPRDGEYYDTFVPTMFHGRSPENGVHCMCFSLEPASDSISSTLNFSRIDNAVLVTEFKDGIDRTERTVDVYAVNYNILRISGGLGGVKFSN